MTYDWLGAGLLKASKKEGKRSPCSYGPGQAGNACRDEEGHTTDAEHAVAPKGDKKSEARREAQEDYRENQQDIERLAQAVLEDPSDRKAYAALAAKVERKDIPNVLREAQEKMPKEEEESRGYVDDYLRANKLEPVDDPPLKAGDMLTRVVWGDIDDVIYPPNTGVVGLSTYQNGAVAAMHVSGDTDYWINRLAEDYGRDPKDAKIITIYAEEGDRLVDDPQYAADPETGIKADSAVLVTHRDELRRGVDFDIESAPQQRESGSEEEARAREEPPAQEEARNPADMSDKEIMTYLRDQAPKIAEAAQRIYDEWNPDDEFDDYGGGGICDEVAAEIGGVLADAGFEVIDGGQEGSDHAYVVAHDGKRAFVVDIPASVYETGAGYSWEKLPDVEIDPSDVQIYETDFEGAVGDDYEDEEEGGDRDVSDASSPGKEWASADDLVEEGFSRSDARDYARRFPHIPKQEALLDMFEIEGLRAAVKDYYIDEDEGAVYTLRFFDDGGSLVSEFEMSLNEDRLDLRSLDVERDYQGRGYGMELMGKALDLALNAEVPEVRLQANRTVGGYAWALMGFDYRWDEEREDVSHGIVSKFEQVLDAALGLTIIDEDQYDSLRNAFEEEVGGSLSAFEHASLVFDLPSEFDEVMREVFRNSISNEAALEDAVKNRRFGKVGMLGTKWYGSLDMRGDGRDIFDEYSEKSRKRRGKA